MIQKWIQERADSNNKINWETAILAGTLFLLPLSEKGFLLGLTFCCFFAVLSIWQKKSVLIRLTKVDTIILLWLLWSSFSLWLSEHGSLGHFILTALLPVFLYFFISRRKRTIENERILLQSLWLGAGAVAIWGLWQVFSGNAFVQGDWVDQGQFSILLIRMYGPLYNPNLLAGYLAMVMAFWTGYRVYRSRTRDGMIGIAGLGLLGICLLLTYSRGAWLSLSAVLLGLGGFGRKKGRYLLWGFVGLCGVILLTDSSITERLTSVFNPTGESSSALRLAIWPLGRHASGTSFREDIDAFAIDSCSLDCAAAGRTAKRLPNPGQPPIIQRSAWLIQRGALSAARAVSGVARRPLPQWRAIQTRRRLLWVCATDLP